jgi:transglutaminase-like putative cysteine protease
MLIKVSHESTFTFEPPVRSLIQILRLTPRNCDGQHVISWRIDVDNDCQLAASEDAFGNLTHTFSLEETVTSFRMLVEGEIRTFDTAGVVRGTVERFPPELYLRTTGLTSPDDLLRTFAQDNAAGRKDPLDRLHTLMVAVHERMHRDDAQDDEAEALTAVAALATSRGSAADFTHLFVTCARVLEIPSRFISGYVLPDETSEQDEAHAWAEAHVQGLGWVAFDPVMKLCPSERHIRVASALDGLGAAGIRSARSFGTTEEHRHRIRLMEDQASQQHQS